MEDVRLILAQEPYWVSAQHRSTIINQDMCQGPFSPSSSASPQSGHHNRGSSLGPQHLARSRAELNV